MDYGLHALLDHSCKALRFSGQHAARLYLLHMTFAWWIILAAAFGTVAAMTLPAASDWLLLSVPCLIAGAIILFQEWTSRTSPAQSWIIIDGSNVMHWLDGTAQIKPLRDVIALLQDHDYIPGIVFDANAGYKLEDRYLGADALAHALGLSPEQVMVVPKGEPADATILAAARDHAVRIVTNDRFRDWADSFPQISQSATLVRGGYRDGAIWLDL